MNITGLLQACGRAQLVAVKDIVESREVDINATATYHLKFKNPSSSIPIEGASALFVAAGNCNMKQVKYLVGMGANVNSRTAMNFYPPGDERNKFAGMSPLHASICLRPEFRFDQRKLIIEFLIANGGWQRSFRARIVVPYITGLQAVAAPVLLIKILSQRSSSF